MIRLAADPAAAPEERSLTVRQAAELLAASESWVRRALETGLLKGHKLGRGVRVHYWSVQDYKRGQAIGAKAPAPAPRAGPGARYRESMATLRRLGVLP